MIATPEKFEEMRPLNDNEVRSAIRFILNDPDFQKNVLPKVTRKVPLWLIKLYLLPVHTVLGFQKAMVVPFMNRIFRTMSDGVTCDYSAIMNQPENLLFISNHRDIIMDPAILDYQLVKKLHRTTVEIAIGSNLMIKPWIERLVKLNKSFTVNRSATASELINSSTLLSEYIHFAIKQKHSSIWMAQREGRAKDSNDRTQKSVLKMLSMAEGGDLRQELASLHITPLSISYEYDPCDYLKAEEFQMKRDNPEYVKSKQSDLNNMKTGVMGYKGHIHYQASKPIDDEILALDGTQPRNVILNQVAEIIDRHIFAGYRFFPGNYIALDMLQGKTDGVSDRYTKADYDKFNAYLKKQISRIRIKERDTDFLREKMLQMYANPLINRQNIDNNE